MRDIRFRAWNKSKMYGWEEIGGNGGLNKLVESLHFLPDMRIMQYTGLKDKNGKEIYELMELDNKWEVDWQSGKYVLRDISTGDIIELNYEDKYEITREYTKL